MELNLTRSIGARIVLLAALNLVLLCSVVIAAIGVRTPQSMQEFMLRSAEERVFDVSRRLALEMVTTPREQIDALLDHYSSSYGATFLLANNDGGHEAGPDVTLPPEVRARLVVPRGAAARLPPERLGFAPLPQRTPFLVVVQQAPRYWLGVRMPIRSASSPATIPGTLIVASSTFFGSALLFEPGRWLMWGGVALALTVLCWLPLLRDLTRRIGRMEHATSRIAEGHFSTALDPHQQDELGRLAASIERMAERLGTHVARQKRFLGDTAHELRSPLTRMQVTLELLERDAEYDAAYVHGLKEDVAEMTRLTDDLLQLAREELLAQTSVAKPTNILHAVQRAMRIEARTGVELQMNVPTDLDVMIDPDALFRAIANVLRNALRYAGDAGPITIAATVAGPTVHIDVADHGPGVPPHALPRLFEPFYRVDEARDRQSGGVGQGLAIVRSIVHACGGTASCRNLVPHGLEVRLSLPRAGGRSARFHGVLPVAERA